MLDELRIRNLGVIDEAVLCLHPGFTVVTGETGAGKTMVVEGLALLVGSRLDSALVRTGADRAVVEATFTVADGTPASRRAADCGADLTGGELIVVRTMSADGRSRCQLGGVGVPVSVLSEVGDELVVRHGQHEQQRLASPATQRELLDRFAGEGVAAPLAELRVAYDGWRALEAELSDIRTRSAERATEAAGLAEGLRAVEAVEPVAGEVAALDADIARLSHADALHRAARAAHEALATDDDDTDVTDLLGLVRRELATVAEVDPRLDALAARVADVAFAVADVAADLAAYLADVDADPARLEGLHQRRAALTALSRRLGIGDADVLDWAATASARLAELDDDGRLAALEEQREKLVAELGRLAAGLTAARGEAAARLGSAVTAELAGLAMPHAQLEVRVEQRDDDAGLPVGTRTLAVTRDGTDVVSMVLAAHAGAPPRPVAKGASGGELSRVMLALEVTLAHAEPVPTMVFDEVDAGIGGAAAVEVGRRLARLARTHQVVAVTHLPQVAAFADRHLRVVKTDDGTVTSSGVVELDDTERLRELSRMLAGLEGSGHALGHAEELLAAAAAAKAAT